MAKTKKRARTGRRTAGAHPEVLAQIAHLLTKTEKVMEEVMDRSNHLLDRMEAIVLKQRDDGDAPTPQQNVLVSHAPPAPPESPLEQLAELLRAAGQLLNAPQSAERDGRLLALTRAMNKIVKCMDHGDLGLILRANGVVLTAIYAWMRDNRIDYSGWVTG